MHISGVDQNLMQEIFVHFSVRRGSDMSPLIYVSRWIFKGMSGIYTVFIVTITSKQIFFIFYFFEF